MGITTRPFNQQDVFTLPTKILLYNEGRLNKNSGKLNVKLVNNALVFLFENIRYEVADADMDRTKKSGRHNHWYRPNKVMPMFLKNAGWFANSELKVTHLGYLNVCLPLKLLLEFSEDYFRILLTVKEELIILRRWTDLNAILSTEMEPNISLKLT